MLFLPIHKHCMFPNPFRVTVLCICSALVKLPVSVVSTPVYPWRREWLPTPVFLPGEFHRQRSLEGYSPWGHKVSDITEQLTHRHTHTHTPIYTPMSNIWESQFLHILINTFSFWLFWWVCSGGVAFWFCISLMTVLSASVMSDSLWPHGL